MTNLKTITPPPEVQTSAKKGLELASKTGLVSSPNIRAIGQALANGEPHSRERLRHLVGYYKAHSADATVRGWGNEEDSPSPAWIAWLLHGGEAGRAWANKHVGKIDMSGPPEGYPHKDSLSPELEQQRAAAPRTSKELADQEYRAILNKSDPRLLMARGGVVPPSPFASRETPEPGSEHEYELLLSKCDPRLLWTKKGRQ